MDIENIKKFVDAGKNWIGPISEKLKSLFDEYYPTIKEYIEKFREAKKKYKDFKDQLNPGNPGDLFVSPLPPNIIVEDVELINKEKLIGIIRANMVSNSNGVAVTLRKKKEANYLYTAFLKNDELLPQNENKYITIVAQGLARDVENLFEKSDIVVLN